MVEPNDPFEHLDEELWAQEAIKEFGGALVADAALSWPSAAMRSWLD